MGRSSLRRELVIPITAVVVGVSIAIGWVSMKAGTDAVNALTQRILIDMVSRINVATEKHLDCTQFEPPSQRVRIYPRLACP